MSSWLFGRRNDPSSGVLPPASGGGDSGSGGGENDEQLKKRMEAYRFDSAALERAAQAARDLEKSSKSVEM